MNLAAGPAIPYAAPSDAPNPALDEARKKRRRRPMTVRRMAEGACADVGPGVTTCHRRRRPSLVEENRPAAEALLRASPCSPALSDVGTILFTGVHVFLKLIPSAAKKRDSIDLSASTPCVRSKRSAITSSVRSFSLRRSSSS